MKLNGPKSIKYAFIVIFMVIVFYSGVKVAEEEVRVQMILHEMR